MTTLLHMAYSLLSRFHNCGHGHYWLFDDENGEF